MVSVERWKRKLRAIGFAGSVDSWPDSQGNDLSVEAVPEDRGFKTVQVIFKGGASDNRTASELLKDFSVCLKSVYGQCQEQVLNCQPR